jgi:hypothetical protein
MIDQSQKDIILYFKGTLDYDAIGELIVSLKDKMRHRRVRFGLYKKILTLMIESLENIIRYRTHFGKRGTPLDHYPPEFLISLDDDFVTIETVNAVFNPDIGPLNERLTLLNSLDSDKLKELYKETITNGRFSERGGAGLGIIEMAKIADEKIDFNFEPASEIISLFYMKLIIKRASSGKKNS